MRYLFDHSLPRILSKRFVDVVAASLLLLVSWPAMLVVALCIRLESKWPVLYRQVRVGESGQGFSLVKFRSMRTDAEGDGVARWAATNDDRVTRVGAFIRKTRLDELPRSEEHTSELQSLMRISYAVFCLKKKK